MVGLIPYDPLGQHAEGLVIDARWNGGGTTADALVELLNRWPIYHYDYRYGTTSQCRRTSLSVRSRF